MGLHKAYVENDAPTPTSGRVTTTTSMFERPKSECSRCGATDVGMFEIGSDRKSLLCPGCARTPAMVEVIETTACPHCSGTGEIAVKDLEAAPAS